MRLASEAAAADTEDAEDVPEVAVALEEEITDPMVAVHMEAALAEAETGRCPMEDPLIVAEAMAVAAVDGGNPFDSSSVLPLIEGTTIVADLFLRLSCQIYSPQHTETEQFQITL